MPRPTLRFGSRGEHVSILQEALNFWPRPRPQTLATDGIFGPKTHAGVKKFQTARQVAADGIVGPVTWGLLEPLIQELLGRIPKPNKESEAAERIIAVAETALATFGWGGGPLRLSAQSPRIAAAKCADPSMEPRPRQGGLSLRSIFQLAGAAPAYYPRCFTITVEAEAKWQQTGSAATAWRNSHDLPSWCGIFCYYVYRVAGVHLGGWVNHKKNVWQSKKFLVTEDPASARPGSIGVLDGIRPGGRNHHFIVKANEDGLIASIDGNAHGPDQNHFQGNWSTVARRRYSHGFLKQKQAYFLFPNFKNL